MVGYQATEIQRLIFNSDSDIGLIVP